METQNTLANWAIIGVILGPVVVAGLYEAWTYTVKPWIFGETEEETK